eukprot:TRINITY_DN8779_c0_g1_i3.p1 TRINITY_DN8779_c0_g1~~TRINITY_DN8779_c0_g1_i3.p1  ORF type:complete len:460 (+),score=60.73 TRINITY_DN8779_c0_g1_i3:58-1380(+)
MDSEEPIPALLGLFQSLSFSRMTKDLLGAMESYRLGISLIKGALPLTYDKRKIECLNVVHTQFTRNAQELNIMLSGNTLFSVTPVSRQKLSDTEDYLVTFYGQRLDTLTRGQVRSALTYLRDIGMEVTLESGIFFVIDWYLSAYPQGPELSSIAEKPLKNFGQKLDCSLSKCNLRMCDRCPDPKPCTESQQSIGKPQLAPLDHAVLTAPGNIRPNEKRTVVPNRIKNSFDSIEPTVRVDMAPVTWSYTKESMTNLLRSSPSSAGPNIPSVPPSQPPPPIPSQLLTANSVSWVRDESVAVCQLCTEVFTVIFRKHHCRVCGRVICKLCSSLSKLPEHGFNTAVRVCKSCYEAVTGKSFIPNLDQSSATVLLSQSVKAYQKNQLYDNFVSALSRETGIHPEYAQVLASVTDLEEELPTLYKVFKVYTKPNSEDSNKREMFLL